MSEQNIVLTKSERNLIMSTRKKEENSSHPTMPSSNNWSIPDSHNKPSPTTLAQSPPNESTPPLPFKGERAEDFDWADDPESNNKQQTHETAFTTSSKYGATRVMSPDEAVARRRINIRSANELFEAKNKSKAKEQKQPYHYDRFAVRNSSNVTPPLSQRTDVPVTESPTHIGNAPKVPAYLIKETKNKRQLANAGIYTMDGVRNVALP